MKECYICSSTKLKLVLDFGKHPPPLNLVTDEQIKNKNEKLFPLELFFCESCGLCQLGQAVDPNEMFKDYTYTSGVSAAFKNHLYSLAELIVNKFKLTGEDLVIDIASNDGTLLKAFSSYGVKVLGVEPSNVAKIAISDGINTVNDFFDESVAKKILEHYGQAKIITATNVLAHVDKLDSFLKGTKLLLKDDDGVFVSESQYLFDIFKKLEYDTIYHEHLRYYGLKQLKKLFSRYEMDVIHAERVSSHGGSIRVFACKKGKLPISTSVRSLLEEEEEIGLSSFDAVKKFVNETQDNKKELLKLLLDLKSNGHKIAGISAPARSSTLLNFCEIDSKILDFVTEKSELKIGKYTPGTHILVAGDEKLIEEQPDYALLLSWHLKESMVKKIRNIGYKGKIIIPLPKVEII